MAEISLAAETREQLGSRPTGRLRHLGKIPGVLYGHGLQPLHLAVDRRELRKALSTEAGLNALLSIKVDGQTQLALARELQHHPVRGTVTHVDFIAVRKGETVSAEVPVTLVGEADEVRKADGVVEHHLYHVTVHATPDRIPPHIEVDISGLEIGSFIRVEDLTLPDGVTTDVDPEELIVSAKSSTLAADLEAAEEAIAEEAAAEAPEVVGEPEEGEAEEGAEPGKDTEASSEDQ